MYTRSCITAHVLRCFVFGLFDFKRIVCRPLEPCINHDCCWVPQETAHCLAADLPRRVLCLLPLDSYSFPFKDVNSQRPGSAGPAAGVGLGGAGGCKTS